MKTALAALLLFASSMFAAGNADKDVLAAIDAWSLERDAVGRQTCDQTSGRRAVSHDIS